jgi:hypothetical protein
VAARSIRSADPRDRTHDIVFFSELIAW